MSDNTEAMNDLPVLPTTVVGSHAKPGWWHTCKDLFDAGEWGKSDLDELLDDAVDIALLDQERGRHRHHHRRREPPPGRLRRRLLRHHLRHPGHCSRPQGRARGDTTSRPVTRLRARFKLPPAWA